MPQYCSPESSKITRMISSVHSQTFQPFLYKQINLSQNGATTDFFFYCVQNVTVLGTLLLLLDDTLMVFVRKIVQ